MKRFFVIGALALAGGGCGDGLDRQERAAKVAEDIARVEAAQNVAPPIAPLSPQPITSAEIDEHKLFGPACSFRAEDGGGVVVARAMTDAAYVKVNGDLRVYAADKGSPSLPSGAWTHYEGREHIIDLQSADGEGEPTTGTASDLPGRLTMRDPYDRVVYSAAGRILCGT